MAKFKVRTGYAYHVPKSVKKLVAGEIVELEDISVGDQKWKLEPVVELKQVAPSIEVPAGTITPKKETKKEKKAREKAEKEAAQVVENSEG